jgi:uncharacterized protein (TIGR02271 family)
MMESTTSNRRMLTAFFDNREDANEAIERLVRAGISRGDIRMVEGSGGSTTASVSRDDEGPGFWEALKDLFLPDEDRATYSEGLRRGGYVVTVQASDASYERALDILDDEGTVDVDQRSETWRSEGWSGTGYSSTTANSGAGDALGSAGMSSAMDSTSTGVRSTTGMGATGTGMGSSAGASSTTDIDRTRSTREGEEAIPIVEEDLRVGKREVEHGRVRVRSYVVETPVQEQVNLREERVHVERRPTDRPLTGSDNVFQERTIEVEERAEQAVVSKEARVKEELVVKKDVEERTETVSDTVRRTEVEVEDERGRTTGTGTTGTSSDHKR